MYVTALFMGEDRFFPDDVYIVVVKEIVQSEWMKLSRVDVAVILCCI